ELLGWVGSGQLRMVAALAGTGLLGLILAAILGIAVTRSIARALAELGARIELLSEGRFGERAPRANRALAAETDELSQLSIAFNRMAKRSEELYGKLSRSEARFRSLIENASDIILITSDA